LITRAGSSCAALLLALAGCAGGGSDPAAGPVPDPGQPPAPNPGGAAVAAWGDSWTSGIGAATGNSYPDQLGALMGRTVFNGGVSGQTSDQIVARQGGAPALLTLPDNSMPGSGPVTVQDQSTFPISVEGPGPITGALYGIHGTLSYNGSLVFERDGAGSPVAVPAQSPFNPDTFDSESQISIFWIGGNNFYDPAAVKSDIAKAVAFLTTDKFVVLSFLNAGSEPFGTYSYGQVTQLNAELAGIYPDNFIDIRRILIDSYDPALAQDVQDHANDVPPSSLRNDDQHPNDAGYAIVAEQVAAFIQGRGW
jgi:lysophospholipase L1-like esterase